MPAERRWLERLCRAGAIAALVVGAWQTRAAVGGRTRVIRDAVPAALAADAARADALDDTLLLAVSELPDASTRAWLSARQIAGGAVRWFGDVAPTGLVVDALADPAGGLQVELAGPAGTAFVLRDSLGTVGRLTTGERWRGPSVVGAIRATPDASSRGTALRSAVPTAASVRRVAVLARAGWEGQFIASALESRGWPLDARFEVRPDTAVRQGPARSFDPRETAVVIALDSSAVRAAPALAAFVRRGGGVILGPDAWSHPAFATLRAGVPGPLQAERMIAVSAEAPREGLPLLPLRELRADAVVLERRKDAVAVAARRIGAGRAITVGYAETWRWRMTGPEGAVEQHRRWWSQLVVAANPSNGAAALPGDAPLAQLVDAVGPRAGQLAEIGPSNEDGPRGYSPWWGLVALGLLVAEWASRRLRGAV